MLTTGQEPRGDLPHTIGAWYENAKGAVFRFDEDPRRLKPDTERPDGPIRHYARVELLSGLETTLVWRWNDTKLLPWYLQLLPTWLLRLVKRGAPKGYDADVTDLSGESQGKVKP